MVNLVSNAETNQNQKVSAIKINNFIVLLYVRYIIMGKYVSTQTLVMSDLDGVTVVCHWHFELNILSLWWTVLMLEGGEGREPTLHYVCIYTGHTYLHIHDCIYLRACSLL